MMPKRYRIEIDVRVDDGANTAIMGLARTQYQSGRRAWAEKDGKRESIPVNDFIEDIESALLELIEAGFRDVVPHAEPLAFRCVLISDGIGYPGELSRP
jgi:hypothetical protein